MWKEHVSSALRRAGLVLVLVGGLCFDVPSFASQPTPPIAIAIDSMKAEASGRIVAVVSVTAHVDVAALGLEVRSPAVGLQVKGGREALRVGKDATVAVEVPITLTAAGAHRIDFAVEGRAEGFIRAGARERRYVVWDGKQPPRLLTGRELRREQRADVDRKLQERLRKDPDARASIDDYLRRPLQKLDKEPRYDESVRQALVAPATGIEPYEVNAIVDKSADVIRELDPITVTGRLWYTDRAGTVRPLINATVDIRDSDTFGDEQLTSIATGWDGRFSAVVNNDDGWFQNGRDIYIRVRTTNTRFRVQDCAAWPDWTYSWVSDVRSELSDGTVVDFGNLATNVDNEASILFQDLNQGWNFLTATGGQDPGFVDLCWPEDASLYSTFWEEIDIEDGDEVARDIVLHEYGHATMHNAYDGHWPSNTGGAHGFNDVLHQNMAFTEGWGTFIALAVNDDGVYDSNGWSLSIEGFNHSSGHGAGDGPRNEGHVAAGMHDVRDRGSDGNCASGGQCDPSGADAAGMAQIWRDAFWRSKADNFGEYWPRLCAELDSAQGSAAVRSLAFNAIDVNTCKCSAKLALATSAAGEADVGELRTLRDRGLRNTEPGQRVIALYYRHTGEVSDMLVKDAGLQRMAAALFVRAAQGSRALLAERDRDGVPLDAEHAKLAREFIARVQEQGSPDLRQDFAEVGRLVDALEGRTYEEVRRKFEAPRKGK